MPCLTETEAGACVYLAHRGIAGRLREQVLVPRAGPGLLHAGRDALQAHAAGQNDSRQLPESARHVRALGLHEDCQQVLGLCACLCLYLPLPLLLSLLPPPLPLYLRHMPIRLSRNLSCSTRAVTGQRLPCADDLAALSPCPAACAIPLVSVFRLHAAAVPSGAQPLGVVVEASDRFSQLPGLRLCIAGLPHELGRGRHYRRR